MKVTLIVLVAVALTVRKGCSEPQNFLPNGGGKDKPNSEEPIETSKCPKEEDPANPTVLPYPGDCSKFYKCLHGRAHPILCQPGLHWSVELNRCDWPEVAKCDPNIKVPSTEHPPKSTPTIVPPTTPGPGRHPECPVDEDPVNPTLLPYPGDCSQFYKCLHGNAHPISCSPGLHWSSELKRCDWPEVAKCDPNIKVPSTKRPPETTPTPVPSTTPAPERHPECPVDEDPVNPTLLPYPGDCSKFYKCLHGNAHPISCSPGLHWSSELKRCDWPEVAKCSPNKKTNSAQVHVASYATSTTAEPPVKHSKCPKNEDPKKPTYLPYPEDCSKFYKCKDGLAIPSKCPLGLHWNTKSNRCDWPNRAGCDPNIKVIPTESPKNSTPRPSTTLAPPVKHKDCPKTENPAEPTYLPYPKDCSKFYRCLHGYAHLAACPSGLHWSKKHNRCDWPEAANCDPKIKTTTESPVQATTIAATTEAPVKSIKCPDTDDPAAPIYLPYPGNCAKFYKCMNRLAHAANCPAGLHWNAKESRCDWPEVAKCDPGVGKNTKLAKSSKAIYKKTDTKKAGSVSKGNEKMQPVTHKDCPDKFDVEHPVHLSYPNDCTKFYKCVAKMAYPMECPAGLHWSSKLERCDWPNVAKCTAESSKSLDSSKKRLSIRRRPIRRPPIRWPPTRRPNTRLPVRWLPTSGPSLTRPTIRPTFRRSTTRRGGERQRPITRPPTRRPPSERLPTETLGSTAKPTNPTKTSTSKPTVPVKNICKNQNDNTYLPHPKDKTKYVHCFNGRDHITTCPSGLHWNQNIKNCDYPKNA